MTVNTEQLLEIFKLLVYHYDSNLHADRMSFKDNVENALVSQVFTKVGLDMKKCIEYVDKANLRG